MDKHNATLPDGRSALLPRVQSRAVWQHFRGMMAALLPLGQSVRIEVCDDVIELTSVYAPHWEAHRIVIAPDGSAGCASEQSAPDYEPDPRLAPWEADGYDYLRTTRDAEHCERCGTSRRDFPGHPSSVECERQADDEAYARM